MEPDKEKNEELNSNLSENDIFLKCAKKVLIQFYDPSNLFQKENKNDFICPICFYVLNKPISCSDKKNSHSFCEQCIKEYLKENYKCPSCKLFFEYKINNDLYNELNQLPFKCLYKDEGCNDIISYSEYLNHINKCKYGNMKYECQIKKYNNTNKEFVKCGFIWNKINMKNHLNLCALIKYKCLFCNEVIIKKNLEEHVLKKCRIRIINYPNENKYIGENNYYIKEGYGILYYNNGERYEVNLKMI